MTTKGYVEFLEDFLAYYKSYRSIRGMWYLCLVLDDYSLEKPIVFSHHKRLRQTIRRKLKRLNQTLGYTNSLPQYTLNPLGNTISHPEFTLNRKLGYDKQGRIRFLENLIKRNKHTKVNN